MIPQKACKDYVVRSYECDKHGCLRLVTLMNIFQDIADSNAAEIGLGLDFCRERGLAWVGANYHIIINNYPKLHQKITVVSWPAVEKKLGAYRDFLVYDENGNKIIQASSQWILINFAKKRPVALRDNLPEYQVIPERAIETEFPKIEDISSVESKTEFKIRFDDIDINNHVNNAIYLLWASEAVNGEFRNQHQPREIEIAFKKEALFGESIYIESQNDGENSIHEIKSTTDNRELARLKFRWKKI